MSISFLFSPLQTLVGDHHIEKLVIEKPRFKSTCHLNCAKKVPFSDSVEEATGCGTSTSVSSSDSEASDSVSDASPSTQISSLGIPSVIRTVKN